MSQRPDKSSANGFDLLSAARTARNSWLDGWSRVAVQFVNTEAYAQMTGLMLDTYLTMTAPYRQMLSTMMTRTLADLNMPSRTEVAGIAERLTNIEMRLDDLDMRVDELKQIIGAASAPAAEEQRR